MLQMKIPQEYKIYWYVCNKLEHLYKPMFSCCLEYPIVPFFFFTIFVLQFEIKFLIKETE